MPNHPFDSRDGRSSDVRVAGSAPRHAAGPQRPAEPVPHGDPMPHAAPSDRSASPDQTAPTRPDRAAPAPAGASNTGASNTGPAKPELGKDEVATRFPAPAADAGSHADTKKDKLMPSTEAQRFREHWRDVQASFVDDPAEAVRRADRLMAEAVEALGQALTAQRRAMDDQWKSGEGDPNDTERMRQALREYRRLVDRVLNA